jgi:hypothetical protein
MSGIFIVGCPRSGTSFLYHLLLAAGGFTEFPTQMNVYDVLEPIYGNLRIARNKKTMFAEWVQSKAFLASGLDAASLEEKVMAECVDGSSFLRIVMEAVAEKQHVPYWIDSTPTNAPHMLRIAKDLPDALFIHIIRDPRDVVLSLAKRGWARPLPWDRKRRQLLAAGLYWKWIVRKTRKLGAALGARYTEVRYEDLINDPRESLKRIGDFLGSPIDYEQVRQNMGSVGKLTSFPEEANFAPAGRWQKKFPAEQLPRFEAAIGDLMEALGYELSSKAPSTDAKAHAADGSRRGGGLTGFFRLEYTVFYEFKQWAKIHTPLTRWTVNYSDILIDK